MKGYCRRVIPFLFRSTFNSTLKYFSFHCSTNSSDSNLKVSFFRDARSSIRDTLDPIAGERGPARKHEWGGLSYAEFNETYAHEAFHEDNKPCVRIRIDLTFPILSPDLHEIWEINWICHLCYVEYTFIFENILSTLEEKNFLNFSNEEKPFLLLVSKINFPTVILLHFFNFYKFHLSRNKKNQIKKNIYIYTYTINEKTNGLHPQFD